MPWAWLAKTPPKNSFWPRSMASWSTVLSAAWTRHRHVLAMRRDPAGRISKSPTTRGSRSEPSKRSCGAPDRPSSAGCRRFRVKGSARGVPHRHRRTHPAHRPPSGAPGATVQHGSGGGSGALRSRPQASPSPAPPLPLPSSRPTLSTPPSGASSAPGSALAAPPLALGSTQFDSENSAAALCVAPGASAPEQSGGSTAGAIRVAAGNSGPISGRQGSDDVANGATSLLGGALPSGSSGTSGVTGGLNEAARSADNTVNGATGGLGQSASRVTGAVGQALSGVTGVAGQTASGVTRAAGQTASSVTGAAGQTVTGATSSVGSVVSGLNSTTQSIGLGGRPLGNVGIGILRLSFLLGRSHHHDDEPGAGRRRRNDQDRGRPARGVAGLNPPGAQMRATRRPGESVFPPGYAATRNATGPGVVRPEPAAFPIRSSSVAGSGPADGLDHETAHHVGVHVGVRPTVSSQPFLFLAVCHGMRMDAPRSEVP